MPLASGSRIGPYEVLSPLGRGGMGEVYRARDSRLKREVALKILPASVAADRERVARFTREAELLAALSHPNIAIIHGVEESNSTLVLVMELVEGDDLSTRIARGPVPLDEALAVAKQLAEALEAAHERGIVHRDLKPANIKVRPDGAVKVLDFGLAKVVDQTGVDAMATAAATRTETGVILGTAAYMPPEQARGKPVDRRADIWAFGCVLYELLTGRRAFIGDTATDVLSAVIEREPDWSLLPAATPESVRRLLRRCLAKDPKRRLHDIADASLDLDDGLGGSERGQVVAVSSARRGRIGWGLALIATAAAGAMAGRAVQNMRTVANGSAADATIVPLTYDSGVTRMPALSPDGRIVAYASDRAGKGNLDIWIQQVSGGTPLPLTDDPADDSTPDFSPDGTQVVFRSERNGGGIYVVSALGGSQRLIAREGRRPRFSPDGSRIAYWSGEFRGDVPSGSSAVFVVALSGAADGAPVRLLANFAVANNPVWAPDGQSLLVAGLRERADNRSENFDWWLAPLDGGTPVKTGVFETPLLRGTGVAPERWTSAGVLFSFGDDLWRVTLSSAHRLSAPPQRLTLGIGPYIEPATGPNGVIFARLVTQRQVDRASIVNSTEPATQLYADSASTTGRASGTSDGSVIVFERELGAEREIWTRDTRTGRQALVVRVPTRDPLNATVSPDGARIAYTRDSARTGRSVGTGFVVETSGGVPRKVCDGCSLHGFLADNHRVLVAVADGRAIRVIDVRTGEVRDLVVAEDGTRLDRPHASPDDRWLAFRRGRDEIDKTLVVRFPTDRPVPADGVAAIDEPTATGRPAGWSLDSRIVYLLLDTDGFRCLWGQRIDPATGVLVGKPFVARHFHAANGVSTSFGSAVTARGFVYETVISTSNLWQLTASEQH